MELNLDAILEDCPEKLLAEYPKIAAKIQEWQENYDPDTFVPYLALVVGSRGSGKSEWAQRSSIALTYDGYATNIQMSTITKKGLNGCISAVERFAPECKNTGLKGGSSEPAYRVIDNQRITFDFFGAVDVKNDQSKKDLLICEEVEKWDSYQGVSALETQIRHFAACILISNNPPSSVIDYVKAHGGVIIEINYDENHALPRHIRESYDRAKIENPSYWKKFIMCQDNASNTQFYDGTCIDNLFSRMGIPVPTDEMDGRTNILSIDVGGGVGDPSVITEIIRTRYNGFFIKIHGEYQLETPSVVVKVSQIRGMTGAIEEIWDADGLGLAAVQQRAPRGSAEREALGIIEFHGNGDVITAPNLYYNRRSEAAGLLLKLMTENKVWFLGPSELKDKLKRELQAQQYASNEISKGTIRLDRKENIKKNLQGESPNLFDSIMMGIHRMMTMPPKQRGFSNHREFIESLTKGQSGSKKWGI